MISTTKPKAAEPTRLLLAAMTLLLAITVPVFAQEAQQGDSTHKIKVPESAQDAEMPEFLIASDHWNAQSQPPES